MYDGGLGLRQWGGWLDDGGVDEWGRGGWVIEGWMGG